MLFQVPAVHLSRCVYACDTATVSATSEWRSCTEGISLQVAIRAWTKVEKISLGGKSVEFPLEPLRYYNFLPNDWSEFKLDRKTHGLSFNLTGWCCFKSQRCTSRGVYMLATLRLYQRRQNGVLCTEGISLQVAIRASTKVEKRFFSSTSRDL